MENIIKFRTENIPIVTRRSKFPYGDVLQSLKVLDRTKSIVCDNDEVKGHNLVKLRLLIDEHKLGFLRHARKNDKCYLWLNDRKED